MVYITQQTFDEAVQENINDLGMSPEEALSEAVSQFLAQGVDLSQVITEPDGATSIENLINAIKKLEEFKDKSISQDCNDQLIALKQECDKGLQYRVQAGKNGAFNVILNVMTKPEANKETKVTCLKAMISLMTKQPDLLDERGAQIIVSNLQNTTEPEIQKFTLKWGKECCVMHEMNRQKFFELGMVDKLSEILKGGNSDILKDALLVLRALILDDDVRVEFGRAHEHARIIATETLDSIIDLIKKFKTEESFVNDLVLTVSLLLVRTEFCVKVEELGGIELIQDIMVNHIQHEKVTRQCFKLLKALAGNDECKSHIIQKGLAPVICKSLSSHQGSVPTAIAGLGCVAALSLRSPDSSKALFEANIPEVIIEIMKKHPNEKSIQRSSSWAIRNMVSRSRYQNKHFLELGVEELLQNNLSKFKDFEYDIKAALRDLECDVQLKEEWTGKGGKISSETSLKQE